MNDQTTRAGHHWGPTYLGGDTWRIATWAPNASDVVVRIDDRDTPLTQGDGGWFAGDVTGRAGDAYHLIVDGTAHVDPAARWLPDGVAGPARLCAPVAPDVPAPPVDWPAVTILEIHVGTFTTEGTFAAAAARMAGVAALGITAVEIMPVAAFSGHRGWGYDGVMPYAVHPDYGTPQDLARLVDAIHAAGMLAILDVVYNHFGPEGASLPSVAPAFFDADRTTPWGPGIDYTQDPVRRFFIDNAVIWARDFGFDAFRLDAVHQIVDPSPVHILTEMAAALRSALPDRPVPLIAEDERNLAEGRDAGVITANWNDDYHHAVHCLLTGEDESYYANFAVDPITDIARALAEGHVEQGQPRANGTRGAPSAHLPPTAFVNSNQTHDQVGNRAQGERLITLTDPGALRVAHAMLLCAPAIPMLFMGEEEGARAPFLFFADYEGEMADAVRKGRAAEFAAFAQFGGPVPDPLSRDTFERSRPYAAPASDAAEWRALTKRCLAWRAAALVPLLRSGPAAPPDVAPTGTAALRARWTFGAGRVEMIAHLGTVPDTPAPLRNPDLTIGDPAGPNYLAVKATTP
ncbi:malto-oligosyltrehalose trehalohydrolase [Jannaschia sp. 2305UL9-9]|uniref:malto-oligosyltrehalose trehalohydrolase n=1 Tax=Jannaschia sp. 2305UL9-9 TaxID=3121638 RepID=UPI003528691C